MHFITRLANAKRHYIQFSTSYAVLLLHCLLSFAFELDDSAVGSLVIEIACSTLYTGNFLFELCTCTTLVAYHLQVCPVALLSPLIYPIPLLFYAISNDRCCNLWLSADHGESCRDAVRGWCCHHCPRSRALTTKTNCVHEPRKR